MNLKASLDYICDSLKVLIAEAHEEGFMGIDLELSVEEAEELLEFLSIE